MNVMRIKRGFNSLSSFVSCDGTSEHVRNVRDEWINVSIKLYDDYCSEVCNMRRSLRVGENEIMYFLKQALFDQYPDFFFCSAFLKEVQCKHTRNYIFMPC